MTSYRRSACRRVAGTGRPNSKAAGNKHREEHTDRRERKGHTLGELCRPHRVAIDVTHRASSRNADLHVASRHVTQIRGEATENPIRFIYIYAHVGHTSAHGLFITPALSAPPPSLFITSHHHHHRSPPPPLTTSSTTTTTHHSHHRHHHWSETLIHSAVHLLSVHSSDSQQTRDIPGHKVTFHEALLCQ